VSTLASDVQKTAVITGSSAGIGKAAAIYLARNGYRVVMLVRDCDKSRAAFEDVRTASGSDDVEMHCVDLASQDSIRGAAASVTSQHARIDVLVNNAGVYKRSRDVSPDGYELTFAVNYLAPVLLTELFLPSLEASPAGRVVNVTSENYKQGRIGDMDSIATREDYKGQQAYAASKMLLMLYTRELAERLRGSGITANCVHPGVAGTDVFREYPGWFNAVLNVFISKPEEAAEPVLHVATSAELGGVTGTYFYKTEQREIELPKEVESRADEILAFTARAVGLGSL
jgi:NAD(P)-dependent dehydrogenase (short-subunit alcohol dehydrogenase family)